MPPPHSEHDNLLVSPSVLRRRRPGQTWQDRRGVSGNRDRTQHHWPSIKDLMDPSVFRPVSGATIGWQGRGLYDVFGVLGAVGWRSWCRQMAGLARIFAPETAKMAGFS